MVVQRSLPPSSTVGCGSSAGRCPRQPDAGSVPLSGCQPAGGCGLRPPQPGRAAGEEEVKRSPTRQLPTTAPKPAVPALARSPSPSQVEPTRSSPEESNDTRRERPRHPRLRTPSRPARRAWETSDRSSADSADREPEASILAEPPFRLRHGGDHRAHEVLRERAAERELQRGGGKAANRSHDGACRRNRGRLRWQTEVQSLRTIGSHWKALGTRLAGVLGAGVAGPRSK